MRALVAAVVVSLAVILAGCEQEADLFQQAKEKENQRDYKGAIEDYTRIIEKAYMARASAKNLQDDHQGAISDYTRLIEINSEHPDAAYLRGKIKHIKLEDYQGAVDDFTLAISINSEDAAAYLRRGESLVLFGDYEGGIDDFTRAMEIDLEYMAPYKFRAKAKCHLGDFEGAVDDYTMAIELAPKIDASIKKIIGKKSLARMDAELYYARANARGGKKFPDHNGIIEDCTEAIRLKPDYIDAFNLRAIARGNTGDHRGMLEDLDKSSELKKIANRDKRELKALDELLARIKRRRSGTYGTEETGI